MKQLGRGSQRIPLHGVLLCLEDFFSILALFRENCDVVKVTADGLTLDDAETEILELRGRLNRPGVFKLEIEGTSKAKYRPLAEISLNGDLGSLTYDADDPKAKGLSTWVLEHLRHRKIAKLLGDYPWLYAIKGAGYTALFLVPSFIFFSLRNRILSLSLLAAWPLLLGAWSVSRLQRKRAVVVLRLENRSDRTIFFVRNKDQLALLVITNVLTALLTMGVTLFVESLKPPTQEHSNRPAIQNPK
jgi:hypothetical protein